MRGNDFLHVSIRIVFQRLPTKFKTGFFLFGGWPTVSWAWSKSGPRWPTAVGLRGPGQAHESGRSCSLGYLVISANVGAQISANVGRLKCYQTWVAWNVHSFETLPTLGPGNSSGCGSLEISAF